MLPGNVIFFVDTTKEVGGAVPKNFPECVKRVVIFPFQLDPDARVCFLRPSEQDQRGRDYLRRSR